MRALTGVGNPATHKFLKGRDVKLEWELSDGNIGLDYTIQFSRGTNVDELWHVAEIGKDNLRFVIFSVGLKSVWFLLLQKGQREVWLRQCFSLDDAKLIAGAHDVKLKDDGTVDIVLTDIGIFSALANSAEGKMGLFYFAVKPFLASPQPMWLRCIDALVSLVVVVFWFLVFPWALLLLLNPSCYIRRQMRKDHWR